MGSVHRPPVGEESNRTHRPGASLRGADPGVVAVVRVEALPRDQGTADPVVQEVVQPVSGVSGAARAAVDGGSGGRDFSAGGAQQLINYEL